jgi:uncharacterized protein
MPEMTSYRHGTPSWVDVSSTDLDETKAFYQGLFGWDALDFGPEAGNYGFFLKDGRDVAGFGPTMGGAPPAWSTYIKVDDVDAAAAKIPDAGGTVVAGPMDLPNDAGRMVYITDSAGAFYGLYQPRQHIGSALVNEEGAFLWNELVSTDLVKSLAFLNTVVGNDSEEMASSGGNYFLIKADGRLVAGAMPMSADWPAGTPSHWATYFMTDDVDGKAERAKSLGGSVIAEPNDMPGVGRMAVLLDSTGAIFSIMKPETVDDPNL